MNIDEMKKNVINEGTVLSYTVDGSEKSILVDLKIYFEDGVTPEMAALALAGYKAGKQLPGYTQGEYLQVDLEGVTRLLYIYRNAGSYSIKIA